MNSRIFFKTFLSNHPKYRGCTFRISEYIGENLCTTTGFTFILSSLSLQVKLQLLFYTDTWLPHKQSGQKPSYLRTYPPHPRHAHTSRTLGKLYSVKTSFVQPIYQAIPVEDSTCPFGTCSQWGLHLEFERAL